MKVHTHTADVKSPSESAFAPVVVAPPSEDLRQLDQAIEKVHGSARVFAKLSFDERIALCRSMLQGYVRVAGESVAVACRAKGIGPGSQQEGEEWMTGPLPIVRHMRLLCEQLAYIRDHGTTRIGKIIQRPDGRLGVRLFPSSLRDALLMMGVTIDAHMQPDVTRQDIDRTRAAFYKNPHSGRTALVLGAGNFASIPVMDVLTKMFNEGTVCVLKMNPVNAYLGPFFEEAFRQAIDRGFLAVVYGGVKEGEYLVRHPKIDEIHITGSDRTYDSIVWGPAGPEQEKRRAANRPLLSKPIIAELGNVSPIIIVPGPYTSRQLRSMAEDIAGYFTMNASFICCVAKIVILPKDWPQRGEFTAALEGVLKTIAPRKAYYPGAADRFETFLRGRTRVLRIGEAGTDTLPWAIANIDAENETDPLFTTESFCPVLGITEAGNNDPADFLERAVDFANERLWGTLSATLVVHPAVQKNMSAAVERAIDRLNYGTVCVNAFPGMSFGLANPPWGAYPGSTRQDIQSGSGWVHNTAMLEGVEKVVARFPLTVVPKQVYFQSHRTARILMKRMTFLEETTGWSKVPGVVLAAMRG
jgi:acyl-CoA reductase-like NAD-dependent aldehyde dehydrogenase